MMRLKAYSFLVLFLAVLPGMVNAQNAITGKVTDSASGEPLSQVDVYNNSAGIVVNTDKEGTYRMGNLQDGVYTIYFYLLGYEVVTRNVEIRGENQEINIEMEELARELTEVTVMDQREDMFSIRRLREVEGTSIFAGKKNEVIALNRVFANKAANNARQVYAKVSGLNIFESNDAGLQLNIGGRGLDPNRSSNFNIRQNGYDISADVLGYPESYYTPPAEAVEEIQVIRGAASLQYGTQFGGLVNFQMNKPDPNEVFELRTRQTAGSNGLLTSFNSVSGNAGKVGYYAYYNYKEGNGFRPNSGFDSDNLYLYLDAELSEKTRLSLDATYLTYLARQPGGLTDVQFINNPFQSNRERNWFAVDWRLASLQLDHRFSFRTRFSLVAYGLDASRKSVGFRTNRVSQQDDPDAPRDLIIGDFSNWGTEARFLHRYTVGSRNAVFLIGSKFYKSDNRAVQGPGSASAAPDFTLANDTFPDYPNQSDFDFPNRNLALFGEHILYLKDNFSVTPGFRYEYIKTESTGSYKRVNFDLSGNPILNRTFEENREFDRQFVLLGIGLSYLPDPGIEFYGNFSQNYRSVTFNDIRIVNPSFQVDPDITDESGFTGDIGVRGRLGEWLSFEAGAFGLMYDDRLGEVLRAETRVDATGEEVETGRVVRFRGNIGRAFMAGVESLVEWNVLGTFRPGITQARFNLYLNTAVTRSEYLDSEIPGVEGNHVEFVPSLNLKAGASLGYRNFLAGLQYTYLSSQFTDASNASRNINDNQSGIRGAIPAYGVADVSVSWSAGRFRIESGINNLFNNLYFTRRATGYPGPGIIPSPPRTWYTTLQFLFDT
ncbi:TonB-dependent receptor [Rhodohalobacter mucosus]|uniref:TonB-dependent receptor n=1 Tax=Rhodohalobacter mucosus TaxID=2079485 RepID=A0A316TSS6_9BACT|nr:TonB-dependent receptor [Rhodohalobacter mucosus]PWN05314.1 TonB-dependent receptor [Rhodohalobacter mucosus]